MQRTSVRPATVNDAASIAEVHVKSWKAAYRDVIPEVLLKRLSLRRRTWLWQDILALLPPSEHVLVSESGGRMTGFIWFGAGSRGADRSRRPLTGADWTLESCTLHTDPEFATAETAPALRGAASAVLFEASLLVFPA